MESTAIAILAAACALAVVAVLITVQFLRGEWLWLLIGRKALDPLSDAQLEKARTSAKRMALVTGALALLLVTIAVYKGAEFAGFPALKSAGIVANNIAFLLFVVALIAFYAMQRMKRDSEGELKKVDAREESTEAARMARRARKARVDSFPTPTLLFLIAVAAIAFGMGLAFSAI